MKEDFSAEFDLMVMVIEPGTETQKLFR